LRTSWLTGLIRDAAWPGLVVLIVHSVLGSIFGHEPYVDPVMHFLGGMAAAFFFSHARPYIPRLFDVGNAAAGRWLAFTSTTTVAVLWEFGEFVGDAVFGTRAHTSIASTLRDILNGMLGSALFLWIQYAVQRGRVGREARVQARERPS
jgi:hypothetical protein